jgi:hypothetical protein
VFRVCQRARERYEGRIPDLVARPAVRAVVGCKTKVPRILRGGVFSIERIDSADKSRIVR